MTAARITLGSGVTSTTNASSTTRDAPTRTPLRSPSAPPTSSTRPMTIAQLAPDTAVRWLSELDFIAASRSSPTALVSPMASPASRSPPSPGSAVAAPRNPARRPSAQPRNHGGPPITSSAPSGKTRKALSSPGSVAVRVPLTMIVVPMPSRSAGAGPKTSTGTAPEARVSTASNDRLPGRTVEVVTAVSETCLPAAASASSSAGWRCGDWMATTVEHNAAAAIARAATATQRTRRASTTSTPASAQHATATGRAMPGIPMSSPAASQPAAAGRPSRRSTVTPSQGLSGRRTSCHRSL